MALSTLVALFLAQAPLVELPTITLQSTVQVQAEPIDEMSGIVKSGRFPNTYWVHNDSGDSARIFAIRADGSTITPARYNRKEDAGKVETKPLTYEGIAIAGGENFDWEDIAIDGDTLYVSDMGNNGNARRDMGIYEIKEPNPATTEKVRYLRFIPCAYPDQKEFPPRELNAFDCEGIFVKGGKVHFLTKWRSGPNGLPIDGTALYRLDRINPDGRQNILTKIGERKGLGGWVTASDLSSDGKKLAVLTHVPESVIWVFDATKNNPLDHPLMKRSLKGAGQCEAICWDSETDVLVTNEGRDIFRVRMAK